MCMNLLLNSGFFPVFSDFSKVQKERPMFLQFLANIEKNNHTDLSLCHSIRLFFDKSFDWVLLCLIFQNGQQKFKAH